MYVFPEGPVGDMPILNVSSRRLHRNAGGLWCRNEKSLASSVSQERISLIHLNRKHPGVGGVCVSPWTLDIVKYPISFVGSSSFLPSISARSPTLKPIWLSDAEKGHEIHLHPGGIRLAKLHVGMRISSRAIRYLSFSSSMRCFNAWFLKAGAA